MTNENISVTEVQNENSVIAERRAKLLKLREHGVAYPNDFVRKDLFGDLNEKYGSKTAEELEALAPKVACAGRVMLKRVMGRLTFATVRDYTGTMQYFVQESTVGEAAYADFKTLDLGDIVACEGTLMRTQAGDLAIRVTSFRLMAKSLRPMPDKHKGLQDQEFCYRRRYVDLMVNAESRERFIKRRRRLPPFAISCWPTTSWKWKRRCCIRFRAVLMRVPSSRTTMRSIPKCTCALRRNFI